jgi:hypothetical protein
MCEAKSSGEIWDKANFSRDILVFFVFLCTQNCKYETSNQTYQETFIQPNRQNRRYFELVSTFKPGLLPGLFTNFQSARVHHNCRIYCSIYSEPHEG